MAPPPDTALPEGAQPAVLPIAPPRIAGPPANCGALVSLDLAPLPEAEARYAAEDQHRRDDLAEQKSSAERRRSWGWVLAGAGAACLGGAGAFSLLGSSNKSDIQKGGFTSASELKDAESKGQTYNTAAYVLVAVGAALVAVGAPLVVLSPNPDHANELGAFDGRKRIVGTALRGAEQ